jgi:hypothetical protein
MQMAMEAQRKQAAIRGELGMKKGGKVKKMMKGGTVKGSASKRADGIITQGHTRGRMV